MVTVDTTRMSLRQIEQFCFDYFKVKLPIEEVVADHFATSKNSYITIFRTKSGNMYALCNVEGGRELSLAEVKAIMRHAGLRIAGTAPPEGNARFFRSFAEKLFKQVYPNRHVTERTDLRYYESLTPYSPALVKIREIHDGVSQYNAHFDTWDRMIDLTYAMPDGMK